MKSGGRQRARKLVLLGLALGGFVLGGCGRGKSPPPTGGNDSRPRATASPSGHGGEVQEKPPALPDFEVDSVAASEGEANWYDVPENSLPQRRAWPGELTAASNRLPPNSYARVSRLDKSADGRSVVVRITDDGVTDKNTIIDLNREAAEALGMIKAGHARVRVEALKLKNVSTDKPVAGKDEKPVAPKASEITDKPVASEQQEKDTANAKTGGQSAP